MKIKPIYIIIGCVTASMLLYHLLSGGASKIEEQRSVVSDLSGRIATAQLDLDQRKEELQKMRDHLSGQVKILNALEESEKLESKLKTRNFTSNKFKGKFY